MHAILVKQTTRPTVPILCSMFFTVSVVKARNLTNLYPPALKVLRACWVLS